jgi:hypothetical protein
MKRVRNEIEVILNPCDVWQRSDSLLQIWSTLSHPNIIRESGTVLAVVFTANILQNFWVPMCWMISLLLSCHTTRMAMPEIICAVTRTAIGERLCVLNNALNGQRKLMFFTSFVVISRRYVSLLESFSP